MSVAASRPGALDWRRALALFGPGLVVMLADTEAGSVITAAQSGAQWGYRLLLLQALVIPLLYMVQELAARLALSTGRGYAELIRQRFGRGLAWLSVLTLGISCFGALVTEMGGLAGAGQIFGIPTWVTISVLVLAILTMVAAGAYQSVERSVIVLGLFELVFLVIAWRARPDLGQVAAQLVELPLGRHDYLYMVAANLGTTVLPWSIFYQQSALIDKGLDIRHLRATRVDTLLGAVLCQVITAAVLMAAAATLHGRFGPVQLDSVLQVSTAFAQVLGSTWGHLIFAIGLSGGALVATVVVCLTVAWTLGEVSGRHHSLEQHPLEAPWFYAALAAMLIGGGALVVSGVNLVRLAIAMGVVNALLLPVALAFLFWLARAEPEAPHRLRGAYAWVVGATFLLTAGVGVYAGVAGLLG